MEFKKLDYYSNATRTSQVSYQEENFIMGLVDFFDNFNIFYNLIESMEKEYGIKCTVLPSFNYQSRDEKESNFLVFKVEVDVKYFKELNEKFKTITYKNKKYSFDYYLEEGKPNFIRIELNK